MDVFFSSRRRHTSWNCDWSSDVCSSDLAALPRNPVGIHEPRPVQHHSQIPVALVEAPGRRLGDVTHYPSRIGAQIGRATCRERVWVAVVAVAVEDKVDNNGRVKTFVMLP